jgi:hypothetical protein
MPNVVQYEIDESLVFALLHDVDDATGENDSSIFQNVFRTHGLWNLFSDNALTN